MEKMEIDIMENDQEIKEYKMMILSDISDEGWERN